MITAQDVMVSDPTYLMATDSLVLAAQKMRDSGIDTLPVLDDDDLLGQLSTHDIVLTCIAGGGDPAHSLVRECTTDCPVTVEAAEPLAAVLRAMAEHRTHRIPVLDGRRFVGMVTHTTAMAATGLNRDRTGDVAAAS